MRVLVIGGTGFIGRCLVPRLLDAGHTVGVVRRPESTSLLPQGAEPIAADRHRLADAAAELRAFAPDVVVDLILSSGRQAAELVEVFRGHGGRIVAASSMDVYRAVGVLHGSEEGPLEPLPLREDSPLRTKLQTYPPPVVKSLQRVFAWLDEEYDKVPVERTLLGGGDALPATVLRLPMIYGPGDRLHRFAPVLKRVDDRRPVIVFAESVARWRAPRGYVENVAAAIALAVLSPRAAGQVYNVGEPDSVTELEWARLVADAAGWTGRFVVVPDDQAPRVVRQPGDLRQHWVVDTTRIREELGYAEVVPRDEAIRRTIDWERAHPPPANAVPVDYAAEDAAVRRANG